MKKRIFENPLIKDRVMLVESSNETGGAYTLIEVELQPGGGNQLHYHKCFTEKFTAIKGELCIDLAGRQLRLQPGESAEAPADCLHRFYNPGERSIIFRVKLTPGHEMFEHGLAIAYGLAKDGRFNKRGNPKSLDHMALILSLTDTGVPGLFSFIQPIMKWRARKAIKKGMHHELINRYCK
ncbi:MAG TPA: cupin domain-containing protein [Chitinophagaceae bacterium]|nr:cupin domain-containing protein [Chitinophagaceae bacterium]